MVVIWKGRAAITVNYNLKRYCFSPDNPVQDIPPEVYAEAHKSGAFNVEDLQIHQEYYDNTLKENKELKEKLAKYEGQNDEPTHTMDGNDGNINSPSHDHTKGAFINKKPRGKK